MSRTPRAAVPGAAVLVALVGCDIEPDVPELRYELNAEAIAETTELAADEQAQAHLRGALEMLFGTPQHPAYLRLEEWIDEEYDPNLGSLRLSDEEFEALKADNRRWFAEELEAIEEGRFQEVERPLYADDLWARWQEHLERMPEDPDAPDGEDAEYTWRENALYLFEAYYPTLRTSAETYRVQCMHCHGTEGGGDGSTARYLNPPPRDYRAGIFKFTALNNKARPRHEDLLRILQEGIYTTAMPSFRRFPESYLHGLADYVELLGKRGETELLLISEYEPYEGFGGLETIQENYAFVDERWQEGDEEVIVFEGEVPSATPERIAHGRELFMDPQGANCVKCHGQNGRGSYDDPRPDSAWETNPETGELELVKDEWGNPIEVRDLSRGVFRFGRRPIDLYRRIYAGINGTPMPAHYGMQITTADGTQRPLDEDDVWDLVHYVRSLTAAGPTVAQHAHAEDGDH